MYQIDKSLYKDFIILEEIGKKSLPIYYNRYDLKSLLLSKHLIFQINFNNNVVGFIVAKLEESKNNIHIMSLAVSPEYRNIGLGTDLIRFLKNKYKMNLTLYVHSVNENAIKFYKKNGFDIQAIFFGYYTNFEINKDAYFMICKNNLQNELNSVNK